MLLWQLCNRLKTAARFAPIAPTIAAMTRTAPFLLSLLLCATPVLTHAQVFRCADSAGKLQFSDTPCAAGQQSSEVRIDKHQAPDQPASAPTPPRMSREAAAYEAQRQQRRQQSNASHQRVNETAAKVQKIRSDNYDPRKCAEARGRMARMERADPGIQHKVNIDYFEFSQAASLYCGN